THGSWLNIVETLFGKMARSFLRHIRVGSWEELRDRILKGIAEINEAPVVHRLQENGVRQENEVRELFRFQSPTIFLAGLALRLPNVAPSSLQLASETLPARSAGPVASIA
ncbi:MAG: hypothetical protein Q8S00_04670, partial [Deltaproteobacteria bacterium]|nr:hypothetical protein [Deltaproteobacteria bacterium]